MSSPFPILRAFGKKKPKPISIRDIHFLCDGELWFWLGLTAFLLQKRFLTGQDNDAISFMDWAASLNVNVLRVFSQVDWDGRTKGVEQGFLASDFSNYDDILHRLFDEAANRGLYVEIVAHTFAYNLDAMLEHSARIDRISSQHENTFYEDANEPPNNRIPLIDIVARFQPRTLACSGQYDPSPDPRRRWYNDHPPRDAEFSRKFKGAIEMQAGTGPYEEFYPPFNAPFVLDEPKRLDDPATEDEWKSFGAGARFFAQGVTGHSLELQKCNILNGDPLNRLRAMIDGVNSVPAQRYFGYDHPNDQGSLRRYRRRGEDGKTYEISVVPFEFKEV